MLNDILTSFIKSQNFLQVITGHTNNLEKYHFWKWYDFDGHYKCSVHKNMLKEILRFSYYGINIY